MGRLCLSSSSCLPLCVITSSSPHDRVFLRVAMSLSPLAPSCLRPPAVAAVLSPPCRPASCRQSSPTSSITIDSKSPKTLIQHRTPLSLNAPPSNLYHHLRLIRSTTIRVIRSHHSTMGGGDFVLGERKEEND
jgi:hypothetical protein